MRRHVSLPVVGFVVASLLVGGTLESLAQRGGRSGGGRGGGGNRTNVGNNVNTGDRYTNIETDGDWNGGGCWGGSCGCCHHPVAAGIAVGAAAAVTAAAIGSTVYALPSGCSTVIVNGITYNDCGGTWYQPQFVGTETTYIVVDDPD